MNQLAYAFIDFIAKAFVVVSSLFYGGKGCAFAFFSEIFLPQKLFFQHFLWLRA